MPNCQNCESHVSQDWVRVMGIDGEVPVCPHCEDRYLNPDAAGVYSEYSTSRSEKADNGSSPSSFDPEYASAGGDA